MIDWSAVAARLAGLAPASGSCRLLSLTLPLPGWPDISLANDGDWCFWQRPDRALRLLGIGRALTVTSAGAGRFAALQAAQRDLVDGCVADGAAAPLAFAGFAYAPQGGAPLPNACLWVPELLLRERGDECSLTLSCAANRVDAAVSRWRALWQALQAKPECLAPQRYVAVRNRRDDDGFRARGGAALRTIAAGAADKLVLTRTLRLQAEAPAPATAVLAALVAQHPACATFGVALDGQVFVGSSPETLLAVDGLAVAVDALAGTAWREAALGLGADKNRREHDFVAQAVADALATLCHDIAVPATPEVLRLNTLAHLRRRITARRPPEVSVFELVARLHPTPAVGGTPTLAALDWLERHGDRRGAWYAGGIGWVDAAGDCDLVVALRCGLLAGSEATLYAGAGFVAGSDPEQELAETEAKFSAMLTALASVRGEDSEERDAA